MAKLPPKTEFDRRTAGDPPGVVNRERPSTPRWVKFVGTIALVLLILIVVVLVAGDGGHGPARHSGSDDSGAQLGPSGTGERGSGGHQPPPDGH
jgi:hypothetical protein